MTHDQRCAAFYHREAERHDREAREKRQLGLYASNSEHVAARMRLYEREHAERAKAQERAQSPQGVLL